MSRLIRLVLQDFLEEGPGEAPRALGVRAQRNLQGIVALGARAQRNLRGIVALAARTQRNLRGIAALGALT